MSLYGSARDPQSATAIVDNSGGAASGTIAAITAGAAYSQADMQAVQNALASLAKKYNDLLTALKRVAAKSGPGTD